MNRTASKLATLVIAAGLVLAVAPAPAAALPVAPSASATVGIYPRCVVTKAEAKRLHLPRTKPGHLCAAPVRVKRNASGEVYELTRIQPGARSWHYVGAVSDSRGRILADVVRRPGPVFGVGGWPECAVTKADAKRLGIPRTKPGALCATRLRESAPIPLGDGRFAWTYVPLQARAASWPLVEVLLKASTQRPVANLVRRPR